jgi:hypothetical protein
MAFIEFHWAPSGRRSFFVGVSQGVALGYPISALQAAAPWAIRTAECRSLGAIRLFVEIKAQDSRLGRAQRRLAIFLCALCALCG